MRVALILGKMSLGARESVDIANFRTTPGMTGTDTGFVRIGECLEAMGHEVDRCYPSKPPVGKYDVALSVNEPDLLRGVMADVRACCVWLNDWSFARAGFDRHVDLFFSPSEAHMEMMRTRPGWQRVEVSQANPNGVERYRFDSTKWRVVELGADPCTVTEPKVPGRVIYASSPDRGLHHVLQEWGKIRRAVPHAHLKVFYRLEPWLRQFDATPFFPPVEALRARANYIDEALRRLGPDSGVTICDSVSKQEIEHEMAVAECLAFPCDTIRWSEGFSCTLLEACAAQACPVTLMTDALPQVYGGVVPMAERNDISGWSDMVIRALTDNEWRDEVNAKCRSFAAERTWEVTTRKMMGHIEEVLTGKPAAWKFEAAQ